MEDRKLYLEAIKKLPEHWFDNETRVIVIGEGRIVAANPAYGPIIYKEETGEWEDLRP